MAGIGQHEAMLWEPLDDGRVLCRVCPRLCRIAPGAAGVCRARINRDGRLYTLIYDRVCSVAADPIEKKPLYHFFPGSTVLSLGSVGCNFACRHCQNWQLAHADAATVERDLRELPVRNLPVLAEHNGCAGIAWTYNEPTIWLEYILDGAQVAHEHGLYTVMVTNGYVTPAGLDLFAQFIDVWRVDIKGFEEATHKRLCRVGHPEAVRLGAELAKHFHGMHVECVTNIVPTVNDSENELRAVARWMATDLGADTPWHVTRFVPYLEFADLEPTPLSTLVRAREIGVEEGLRFVYMGNVDHPGGEDTACPSCGALAIARRGFSASISGLNTQGGCAACGAELNVHRTGCG